MILYGNETAVTAIVVSVCLIAVCNFLHLLFVFARHFDRQSLDKVAKAEALFRRKEKVSRESP